MEKNILHVVSIFINAFLKAFLEIGFYSLQHCTVNLGNIHANNFIEILQCMRLILIHTCLEVSPEEIITNALIRWPREPRNVSKPGNEAVIKEWAKHVYWCSGCVSHRSIVLKPHASDKQTFLSKFRHKEVVDHLNVGLRVHSHSISVIIFKKERTNDSSFINSTPDCHFCVMLWSCSSLGSSRAQ